MDTFTWWFHLIFTIAVTSAQIYSFENADGSYTIGHTSDSRGEPENSVVALLTKAAGYTLDSDYEDSTPPSPDDSKDHLEVLQLVETFVKLKAALMARLRDLVTDNYQLGPNVYRTIISKAFTLTGVRILRRICEFALALMGSWQ